MQRLVLPVIHFLDQQTAISQARLAFSAGADGVFLISHEYNADPVLHVAAREIKQQHADKLIGLNLETYPAQVALEHCLEHGMDMLWVDNPGITSRHTEAFAREISQRLRQGQNMLEYFASVAFKYQDVDPDPAAAARAAASLSMVPTTSGDQTGKPPEVAKIRSMREAIEASHPLAIASGMSPENVRDYTPFASHFLVATNVSIDDYHFDAARLARFVELVKTAPDFT